MNINDDFGPSAGQSVEVVGFWRRFVAYLIDIIILQVVNAVIGVCAGIVIAGAGAGEEAADGLNLVITCLSILISAGYFIGFWVSTGQTLGKLALGIKVISVDGSPISGGQAFLRYIGYGLSGLVFFLGFIWVAVDDKKQGWHDKIAKTYVVRKTPQFLPTGGAPLVEADLSTGWIWVIVYVAIFVLIAICVIATLLLLGPVVGNVFSNIVENLGTPSPQ